MLIKIYLFYFQKIPNISFLFFCFLNNVFQKFQTFSYCVGGQHCSSTLGIEGDITKSSRTFLIGKSV